MQRPFTRPRVLLPPLPTLSANHHSASASPLPPNLVPHVPSAPCPFPLPPPPPSPFPQGGLSNVVSMFLYLLDAYQLQPPEALAEPEPVIETPPLGCLHPLYKGGRNYFSTPAEYMKW